MKKILIYIIPILAVMTACNDLDKVPQDSVSSEVYFQNEDQLEQYSNQFYTLFPSASEMYDEVSDEIALMNLHDEVLGTRIVPADASGTQWNWSMLRHINYLIEHAKQCKDATVADEYVALARFFRAYCYYEKVRCYGDVPWLDHALGNSEVSTYAKRDSRTIVMRNVVADLNYAIEHMTSDKSNVYRVNRYTAMALKARACLFEGTFCKYHTEIPLPADVDRETYWREMLTEAASAAKMLMDAGVYSIYNAGEQPYRALFSMGHVQGCSEYILARCYSLDLKLNHNATGFTLSSTTGKPGFTKRLVGQYLNADGTRFTDNHDLDTVGIGEEMNNRDPRMEQTIFRPGHYIRVGNTEVEKYDITTSSTGYQLIKYVMDKSTDTYNQSDCDMPLFRIAEVYLNYAEAKAELDELTQEDLNSSLNKVRERVKMPPLMMDDANKTPCTFMTSLYPNVDKGGNMGVILEIRRERNIELVQEGLHYWDLMRWKEGQALAQPYLGVAFKGVSKSSDDRSGMMDTDLNGRPDLCACMDTKRVPFSFGIKYVVCGTDVILSRDSLGGCILSNGTPDISGQHPELLNNGRKWNESRDYLYPVPIRERVLSEGKISQNPGWDDGLAF